MSNREASDTRIPASNGDEINQQAGEFQSPDSLNPYKPEDLWIDPSLVHKGGAVRKLLTTVPIRKPNKHEFFRIHPGEEYWKPAAFIDFGRQDYYLVLPRIVPHLDPADYFYAYLCLAVSRQGNPFFWPLKAPDPERRNAWNESAIVVVKAGIKDWIKLKSRQEDGKGGGFYEGEIAIGSLGEPAWPQLSQKQLYDIAFKGGRIIDQFEHEALQKLSGII